MKNHQLEYLKAFVGTTITNAEFDGDRTYGLRIQYADGRQGILWIMRDPEGNGPGYLDEEELAERTRTPKVGDRVWARTQITEGGDHLGDVKATFPSRGYIHALPMDQGVIVDIAKESGMPTVRFLRTGTATLVGWSELVVT